MDWNDEIDVMKLLHSCIDIFPLKGTGHLRDTTCMFLKFQVVLNVLGFFIVINAKMMPLASANTKATSS